MRMGWEGKNGEEEEQGQEEKDTGEEDEEEEESEMEKDRGAYEFYNDNAADGRIGMGRDSERRL